MTGRPTQPEPETLLPAGGRLVSIAVPAAAEGERLDRVIAAALGDTSRSRIKALIEADQVSLDGATISEPSRRVKLGQIFTIRLPEPADPLPKGQAIALEIVYEDAELVVVDKPAGMVVHPAPGNLDRTLVNALIAHCGASLSGVGGVRRPGIVHRLDKDTSGLIVAAKTDTAHRSLADQFAGRTIERAYQAFVLGVPSPPAGEIEGNIGRARSDRKRMALLAQGGKPALTRYRTLRAFGTLASHLECRLATGRTHQIRVHLAARGHPLIGDPTYGRAGRAGRALPPFGRQALHAWLLGFTHPTSGKHLRFESNLPQDLTELQKRLESL